jgi:hypothetical protein
MRAQMFRPDVPIAAVLWAIVGVRTRLDDSSAGKLAGVTAGGPAMKTGKPSLHSTRDDAAIR